MVRPERIEADRDAANTVSILKSVVSHRTGNVIYGDMEGYLIFTFKHDIW